MQELDNTYSETSNYKVGFTKYNKSNYINFIIENFNMDYGIPPSFQGHANGVDIGYFLIRKNALNPDTPSNISFEEDILPKFIENKEKFLLDFRLKFPEIDGKKLKNKINKGKFFYLLPLEYNHIKIHFVPSLASLMNHTQSSNHI